MSIQAFGLTCCVRLGSAIVLLWGCSLPAFAEIRDALTTPSMQSPLSSVRPLLGVTQAGNRIVAVGRMGHIVYSDDQGRHWTQGQVPVSVDLVAVNFVNAKQGWAVGHDGVVLHSDDGGASWDKQLDGRAAAKLMGTYYQSKAPSTPQIAAALTEAQRFAEEKGARPFLDVWFENERSGFIIGAWGLIFRTQDGGETWEPWMERVDNPRHSHLNAIRPAAGAPWIVGEQGLVVRYDTAAKRFVAVHAPTDASLFGLVGKSDLVLVFGLLGDAFISHDNGRSWTKAGTGGSVGLSGGTVLPDGKIVLIDTGAGIWQSADNAKTFSLVPSKHPMPWFGVTTIDADRIALVGVFGTQVLSLSP